MPASIHTGGVAFFLTTILGGAAGIFAVHQVLFQYAFGRTGAGAAIVLALGHVPGAAAFGAAMGAVASLVLFGQTLARCFHQVFLIALAWATVIGTSAVLPWASQRFFWRFDWNEELILLLALPAAVLALGMGQWLARSSTGFSRRARPRAAAGALIVFAASILVSLALYGARMSQWNQDIFAVALWLIPCGAFAGALFGADRTQRRGFGILPATPISDAPSTPPPPARLGRRSP